MESWQIPSNAGITCTCHGIWGRQGKRVQPPPANSGHVSGGCIVLGKELRPGLHSHLHSWGQTEGTDGRDAVYDPPQKAPRNCRLASCRKPLNNSAMWSGTSRSSKSFPVLMTGWRCLRLAPGVSNAKVRAVTAEEG